MGKLLIFISILPIVAYWVARKFLSDAILAQKGTVDCRMTGNDFAKKLGYGGKLSRRLKEGKTAQVLAEISLQAAYERLAVEQNDLVKWRMRIDVWGRLVVPMSIMIASFAMMAGRPATLCIGMALAVNAIVVMLKWTTRGVVKFAAEKAVVMMTQSRIPRQEDESSVEQCIRAWTWR
jgi:hypothetical protein